MASAPARPAGVGIQAEAYQGTSDLSAVEQATDIVPARVCVLSVDGPTSPTAKPTGALTLNLESVASTAPGANGKDRWPDRRHPCRASAANSGHVPHPPRHHRDSQCCPAYAKLLRCRVRSRTARAEGANNPSEDAVTPVCPSPCRTQRWR